MTVLCCDTVSVFYFAGVSVCEQTIQSSSDCPPEVRGVVVESVEGWSGDWEGGASEHPPSTARGRRERGRG